MYVSRMETVTVAWSLWLCFLYPPEAELPPCPMISANTAVLARYCLQAGMLFHQLGPQSTRPRLHHAP